MNKKLKRLLYQSLFVVSSAAVWLACAEATEDPAKETSDIYTTESTAQEDSAIVPHDTAVVKKNKNIQLDNVKLISYTTASIISYSGNVGLSHTYQMATFETPKGHIDLLIPYPKNLAHQTRYKLEYEPLDPKSTYLAQDFANRFILSELRAIPNYELDQNLDGIVMDLEILQKK